MAIPKLTKDLKIIQKLSDLPNATDGLTADELKARFDEAGRLIKEYLNESLVPAICSKNIPFTATSEIAETDVQAAIENVQSQVRDAASGTIVNGSVTKEKLAAELLARAYGGRPWVSAKTPDSTDNVAADFPIGQVWLRPAFHVVNLRSMDWTTSGCTVTAQTQKVTMTGNNTTATASMTQALTNIGLEDDLVYILFDVAEQDSEITSLSASVNGGTETSISGAVALAADLMVNGSLELKVTAVWPSSSLADGNVVLDNLAIVNVSQVMRQLTEGHEIPDWAAYLRNLLPLDSYHSPSEIYIQITDGNWWPMSLDVLPVDRGGTGLKSLTRGQLLYAAENDTLAALEPPAETESVLVYNGEPLWQTKEQMVNILGQLQLMTGTYTGNAAARTVTLPVTPKLLHIFPVGGMDETTCNASNDWSLGDAQPAVLADGATAGQIRTASYRSSDGSSYVGTWASKVSLSGSTLTFAAIAGVSALLKPDYMNRSGVTYRWTAIY